MIKTVKTNKTIDRNNSQNKQKSILDYFNRKGGQQKRSSDEIEIIEIDSFSAKCAKRPNNCDISPTIATTITTTDPLKSRDCNADLTKDKFIDLNKFLEIDISIEDKPIHLLEEENDTSDDIQTHGSYIYQSFRQMIDFALEDNQLSQLFNETDRNVIQAFTCLSGNHIC